MSERLQHVSPIFFSCDGRWDASQAAFPRGTVEVEALLAGVVFVRGDLWEILWEWNGMPHIYDCGTWQQHNSLDQWTFRLCGDEDPLVPGRYRVTLWRNGEAAAQGEFVIRGPAPPAGGRIELGDLALYRLQGRTPTPCSRRDEAHALGVVLAFAELPRGALIHVIWRCRGRLIAVENRSWRGSATGEELLLYMAEPLRELQRGLYELWVACWPAAPLYRSLSC